jgi:hypothetical protein
VERYPNLRSERVKTLRELALLGHGYTIKLPLTRNYTYPESIRLPLRCLTSLHITIPAQAAHPTMAKGSKSEPSFVTRPNCGRLEEHPQTLMYWQETRTCTALYPH